MLSHPPHSPDLAPSDFHLFQKLKEHLKGQRFSCDEEVKSAVRKWVQKQNTYFFKNGFQKLGQRWWKYIEVQCVASWWKNNYAAWKIIDVGIFIFYFIKITFTVYFLSRWRQNVSARLRIYKIINKYIYITNIPPIMIINRIYEYQNLLSL